MTPTVRAATLSALPAQSQPPESDNETPEARRTRQAEARAARAAARSAARALVPQRSSEFDHLGLDELRVYRTALIEEEDKVSYWRRILQARLDVVRVGGRSHVDVRQMAPVLAPARVQGGRTALVTIVPSDDVPPLPDLARLWEMTPGADDHEAIERLDAGLVAAEIELSAYRSALHRRLDAATTELIARYREDPQLCLRALPLGH